MDHHAFGALLSHLITERILTSGTNGSVYLVRDTQTGMPYIYRVFSGKGDICKQMQLTPNPHLPRIHYVAEENGSVYVLEECVQGESLAAVLRKKTLSKAQAKKILTQLCQALSFLHGLGAVHLDIRPENVVVQGEDAVLMGFDPSRRSQADPREDIYALGILLNRMRTGQHPSQRLASGSFRSVIQTCTQLHATQRYASAEELIQAMNPPSGFRRILRFILWGVLILALAGGLMLAGGFLFTRTDVVMPTMQAVPEETQATEAVTEPQTEPTELPEIQVFQREQLHVEQTPWTGQTNGYTTTFQCDMDQDGKMEKYLFGLDFIDSPHPDVVYTDRNGFEPNEHHIRHVHPCVWRVLDNGSLEVAAEFAPLLTDVSVKLWRVDDFTTPDPEMWTRDYTWPGCVSITFFPAQNGSWVYDITAYFGDQQLTASAITTFYLR